ncbi:MAG: hypothetical protein IT204_16005 [Fimbriimonadaceae bacterium]|nr:hypothetical protein [Fimbriimonadaceae bacterium]
MRRFSYLGLLGCLAAPLAAQQTDAQKIQIGQVAFADMPCLDTFLDLGITNGQASAIAKHLAELQETLREQQQRRLAAENLATADLRRLRDSLLTGQAIGRQQLPALARLEALEPGLAAERKAALEVCERDVLAALTAEQRARVAAEGVNVAAEEQAAAIREQQQLQEQRQRIYQRIGQLFTAARNVATPAQFEAGAPGEVANVIRELTSLTPNDQRYQQLGQFMLQRLTQIFRMRPNEYAQQATAAAAELTNAVLWAGGRGGSAAVQRVPVARLREALAYERGPLLLQELAKRREG